MRTRTKRVVKTLTTHRNVLCACLVRRTRRSCTNEQVMCVVVFGVPIRCNRGVTSVLYVGLTSTLLSSIIIPEVHTRIHTNTHIHTHTQKQTHSHPHTHRLTHTLTSTLTQTHTDTPTLAHTLAPFYHSLLDRFLYREWAELITIVWSSGFWGEWLWFWYSEVSKERSRPSPGLGQAAFYRIRSDLAGIDWDIVLVLQFRILDL